MHRWVSHLGQRVFGLYVAWRLWLLALVYATLQLAPPLYSSDQAGYLARYEFGQNLPEWITTWANFDGVVFLRIAYGGYGHSEAAFFPLLPWLVRWGEAVTGAPYIVVGMVLSTVALLIGLYYAARLWRLDQPNTSFLWFVVVLLSFPTAHYFTAVYQDAIFFAVATATLWYARNRQWPWAILAAMIGMLARLNGLALLVILIVEYFLDVAPELQRQWGWRSILQRVPSALQPQRWFGSQRYVWGFALVPLTFVGFLAMLQRKLGDWHVFFSSVEVWNRDKLVFPLQTFWRYGKILVYNFGWSFGYAVSVLEAAFTALYGWVLIRSWGKIRLTYWWWMLAHFTIPVVTGTLQGMPRYGLHAYPLFLVLAGWVSSQPRWVRVGWVLLVLALQVWYIIAFTQGKFVA